MAVQPIDSLEGEARLERRVAEIVAAAPKMTAEQRDKLRRVFRYGPPSESSG